MGVTGQAMDRVGLRIEQIAAAAARAESSFRAGDTMQTRLALLAARDEVNRALPVLRGRSA